MIKHSFHSDKPDGADTTLIKPSDWNAEHEIKESGGDVLSISTIPTGKFLKRVGGIIEGADAVISNPSGSHYKVTNIYVDKDTGQLLLEYIIP